MKAWERTTSLRDRCSLDPQERETERNEGWQKSKLEKRTSRGEWGRKATFDSHRQIQNPSVFHPCGKTRRECLASVSAALTSHTDGESKWATKMSPPSPLIRCRFLLPSSTKKRRDDTRGVGKKDAKMYFSSAPGVWTAFIEPERQPWVSDGELWSTSVLVRFNEVSTGSFVRQFCSAHSKCADSLTAILSTVALAHFALEAVEVGMIQA